MKQHFQCRLRKGSEETVGWIEQRGAKVGLHVELKEDGERWEVLEVYQPGLSSGAVFEKQVNNRNAFSSIKAPQ